MISVQNVSKSFKDQKVLDDVSVELADGLIHGLVGRNGSGKTVLLKCIIGLIKPDAGRIMVDGQRIGKDTNFIQDVGFIIDQPGFLYDLSGFRNLKYLASIRGKIGDDRIREVIELVGLDPRSRKHVGKYSMGMKQRLGIAQALMEDPAILIFDEPMNGLDQAGVTEMRALIRKLSGQQRMIILTSHNEVDIREMCDRTYAMEAGRLEEVS